MSNTTKNPEFAALSKAVTRERDAAERQLRASLSTLRARLDDVESTLDARKFTVLNTLGELQSTVSKFEAAVGALTRLSEVQQLVDLIKAGQK